MQAYWVSNNPCNLLKSIFVKELERNPCELQPNRNHLQLRFDLLDTRRPFSDKHGLTINLPQALVEDATSSIGAKNPKEKGISFHFVDGNVASLTALHTINSGVNYTFSWRLLIELA